MPILLVRQRFGLEFLWLATQVCAVMKPDLSSRRRANASDTLDFGQASLNRPSAPVPSEVLGEIGLLIAAHLALAFAIVFTLQQLEIG